MPQMAKTDSIGEVATEATCTRDRDEWIAGLRLGEEGAVLTWSKDPERTGFGE